MTLCPIALVASCRRCALVSVCPVKRVIGDYRDVPDDMNSQNPPQQNV